MLTIHYQGTSEPKIIRSLVAEISAIAEEMQWNFTTIEDEKYTGIIVAIAEKCDPLYFIINNQGRLINIFWLNSENPPDEAFYIAVKTNFSSIETHIIIVKLLKYVKQKYINNLVVTDEGEYYETENMDILIAKWNFLLKKHSEVSQLFENCSNLEKQLLTTDELINKIEKLLLKYLKK